MSKPHRHLYDPPRGAARAVLFRDRPALPEPGPGPLSGRRVLLVVAPTWCSGNDVRILQTWFSELGAVVGIASECQGEARDERRRPVYPHRLLVEIVPAEWDAILFVGGRGALRVSEDELARTIARQARLAGAVGQGAAVLRRAQVAGLVYDRAVDLAEALAARLGAPSPGGEPVTSS